MSVYLISHFRHAVVAFARSWRQLLFPARATGGATRECHSLWPSGTPRAGLCPARAGTRPTRARHTPPLAFAAACCALLLSPFPATRRAGNRLAADPTTPHVADCVLEGGVYHAVPFTVFIALPAAPITSRQRGVLPLLPRHERSPLKDGRSLPPQRGSPFPGLTATCCAPSQLFLVLQAFSCVALASMSACRTRCAASPGGPQGGLRQGEVRGGGRQRVGPPAPKPTVAPTCVVPQRPRRAPEGQNTQCAKINYIHNLRFIIIVTKR